jgi:hypothetical protein
LHENLHAEAAAMSNYWLITIRFYMNEIGDIGSTGSLLSAYASTTASRPGMVNSAPSG